MVTEKLRKVAMNRMGTVLPNLKKARRRRITDESRHYKGERTRPRVQFPASRRKAMFGGTPNSARLTRALPYNPLTHG